MLGDLALEGYVHAIIITCGKSAMCCYVSSHQLAWLKAPT